MSQLMPLEAQRVIQILSSATRALPWALPGCLPIFLGILPSTSTRSTHPVRRSRFHNTNLDTVNFSGEGWLRIPTIPISYTGTATSNNMTDLTVFGPTSGGGDSTHTSWQLDLNLANSGRIDAWVGIGSGWTSITSGATGQSGKVVYVVETYDGANLRFLYERKLGGRCRHDPYESGCRRPHLFPFVMGSYQQGYFTTSTPIAAGYERARFYTGGMAHVAVYNYALSAVQVTNHYYASTLSGVLPPPTPTL